MRTADGLLSVGRLGADDVVGLKALVVGVERSEHEAGVSTVRLAVVRPVEGVPEFAGLSAAEMAAVELLSASGWTGDVQELADLAVAVTSG